VTPVAARRRRFGYRWPVTAWWVGLAWVALLAWWTLPLLWWRGMRRVPSLGPDDLGDVGDVGDGGDGGDVGVVDPRDGPRTVPRSGPPRVAIVVAARDEAGSAAEAAALAAAARGWLELEGVAVEVVVVDDRSSDGTAEALRSALGDDPRARLLRVEALPDGWLGKVHAQAMGVAATSAPWVLLTDADVRLHPRAVAVAMGAADRGGADHVALLPRFGAGGLALRAFVTGFALLLTVLVRPWEAGDPRSPRTLGIGAFGLYRRAALERAGGLGAVRARPDDDLALARAVKAAGGRSLVAFGPDLVEVEWYPSLAAALRGLEKNAFAGVGYRPAFLMAAVLGLLATHVAPFVMAVVGPAAARGPSWGVVAAVLVVYAIHGRWARHPALLGLLHPLTVTLLAWAMLRSAARTLVTGQVRWRGRSYPVARLRAAARAAEARDRAAARARAEAPRRRAAPRKVA
jgi:hypothetical protein